jgi:hypothetical protein
MRAPLFLAACALSHRLVSGDAHVTPLSLSGECSVGSLSTSLLPDGDGSVDGDGSSTRASGGGGTGSTAPSARATHLVQLAPWAADAADGADGWLSLAADGGRLLWTDVELTFFDADDVELRAGAAKVLGPTCADARAARPDAPQGLLEGAWATAAALARTVVHLVDPLGVFSSAVGLATEADALTIVMTRAVAALRSVAGTDGLAAGGVGVLETLLPKLPHARLSPFTGGCVRAPRAAVSVKCYARPVAPQYPTRLATALTLLTFAQKLATYWVVVAFVAFAGGAASFVIASVGAALRAPRFLAAAVATAAVALGVLALAAPDAVDDVVQNAQGVHESVVAWLETMGVGHALGLVAVVLALLLDAARAPVAQSFIAFTVYVVASFQLAHATRAPVVNAALVVGYWGWRPVVGFVLLVAAIPEMLLSALLGLLFGACCTTPPTVRVVRALRDSLGFGAKKKWQCAHCALINLGSSSACVQCKKSQTAPRATAAVARPAATTPSAHAGATPSAPPPSTTHTAPARAGSVPRTMPAAPAYAVPGLAFPSPRDAAHGASASGWGTDSEGAIARVNGLISQLNEELAALTSPRAATVAPPRVEWRADGAGDSPTAGGFSVPRAKPRAGSVSAAVAAAHRVAPSYTDYNPQRQTAPVWPPPLY